MSFDHPRAPRAVRSTPPLSATSVAIPAPRTSRGRALVRVAVLVALLLGVALLAWKLGLFRLRDRAALAAAIQRVHGLPFLVPGFVLAYALAVTFGLPASPLTLAGGVLFGFWRGSLFNWRGATSGASLAYLFAGALCGGGCRALLGRKAEALEHLA